MPFPRGILPVPSAPDASDIPTWTPNAFRSVLGQESSRKTAASAAGTGTRFSRAVDSFYAAGAVPANDPLTAEADHARGPTGINVLDVTDLAHPRPVSRMKLPEARNIYLART